MKQNLILMVDDDEDYYYVIKEALRALESKQTLRHVDDGEELMDYLKHRKKHLDPASSPRPGLILLDINMPKKTGFEVLKEIRADAGLCTIPIVMLTASDDPRDAAMSYHFGANSFVTKPSHFPELIDRMKILTQYWFEIVTLPNHQYRFEG